MKLLCSIFGHKLYRKASGKPVEMFPEDETKAIFTEIIYCSRCGYSYEKRTWANL